MDAKQDLMHMEVKGFAVDEVSKTPILILQPGEGEDFMPIWIGPSEASAIALSLSGAEYERPLTHDLIKLVCDGMDARHLRTVVTGLEGSTFLARILLERKGDYLSVDCRPSDGIAFALRTGAEILIARELFESHKQRLGPRSEERDEKDSEDA